MTLVKVAPNEQQEFKSFDLEINCDSKNFFYTLNSLQIM